MAFATASGDMANFSPAFCIWALSSGFLTCSLKAVSVKPGRMVLTRICPANSCRRPSERARTAAFVAE